MGKRKHVSKKKDLLSISKRKTRSASISVKNSEPIPVDIVIEILSRLPVKSIARLRCVSKEWNSILRSLDFTNSFLTVSYSRPRLLFLVKTKDTMFVLSAPQPLNPDKSSSPLLVDYHMSFPMINSYSQLHTLVNGLFCTEFVSQGLPLASPENRRLKRGYNDSKVMIHNPSTGQSISLPKRSGRRLDVKIYLGYDPINEQYKVLCLSMHRNQRVVEHHVLTLGVEKPAWKMIECSTPLCYPHSSICINGVLYYVGNYNPEETIVCFDVRSEKVKSIKAKYRIGRALVLINYTGKLGVLPNYFFTRRTTKLELVVLDDVDKNDWSQHIYIFPPSWQSLVGDLRLHMVGRTRNGEFVFAAVVVSDPFYVFFYNVEKNTIERVTIQGIESSTSKCILTFLNHVEDVKLM